MGYDDGGGGSGSSGGGWSGKRGVKEERREIRLVNMWGPRCHMSHFCVVVK